MNASKLNDWLQVTAAVGVIAGLVLVAYEIRVSNRIGLDQANSESMSKYAEVIAVYSSAEGADLFVRANEGDVLSRQEMARFDEMLALSIGAVFYDWSVNQSGTISTAGDFTEFYAPTIQWYLGSDIGRRKWATDSANWPPQFVAIVDNALAAPEQADVLAELDYFRGETDSIE